jgi:periplasmic divalent cation tolerance protein
VGRRLAIVTNGGGPAVLAADRASEIGLEVQAVHDLGESGSGAAYAELLAAALVEQRVAACVNVLMPAQSVFRWKGHVESASEVPLVIKTTAERYPMLEQAILAGHPYELPEIVAVPVEQGLPAYLEWVAAETRPAP